MGITRSHPQNGARVEEVNGWTSLIRKEEWSIFSEAVQNFHQAKIPVLLAGAFGLARYTGRLRNTKDLDFCIQPDDKVVAIDCLTRAGFNDYYSHLPYDREWIYRSVRDNFIIDVIWSMANQRAHVGKSWFHAAPSVNIYSDSLRVVPVEYLIWMKLYVLQKDRSDWLDLVNLLYASVKTIDWDLLVKLVGRDLPLLKGVIEVFNWVCPGRAQLIPTNLRQTWHLQSGNPDENLPIYDLARIRLLDSRPWFAALQPIDELMKI